MEERKAQTDATQPEADNQPEGSEATGDSWKSDSQNDVTSKPGQVAAGKADDPEALEDEGVADGS